MDANKDFDQYATDLLPLVGGTENIIFLTHCATRLRLNVKDKNVVQLDDIKNMKITRGAQWSGDQLQIIIGADVDDTYQSMLKLTGNMDGNDAGTAGENKKFKPTDILDALAGCMAPLIPLLLGLGLIKVIVMVCKMTGILNAGSPTDTVLTALGDSGLYFLPIFVGATASQRFKTNLALSMWVCALMIHPSIIAAATGDALSIFGLPIYQASYTYTLVPSILVVWVMSYVENFIAKHSPKAIRTITEPLLTALVMTPLVLCLLAPLGNIIGIYVSAGLNLLYNTVGFVAVGLLAAFCPFIVMTGMHAGLLPVMVQSFASLGCEGLMLPANVISNINQGIATFTVGFKNKDEDIRSEAVSCGISAVVAGVTEPAMFGITLKYKTPMYAAMIGSGVGGVIAGLGKCKAYAMTTSNGLFALPAFLSTDTSNIIWYCVAVAVGIVVTFIAAMILYKPEVETSGQTLDTTALDYGVNYEPGCVYAPMDGNYIPLEDIPDPVFSEGVLGQGCGIEPTGDTVFAPVDGKIVSVAGTKHAIGIAASNGEELLIHVGMDTVNMNGRGFIVKVNEGDTVKAGQPLLTFDTDAIKAAKHTSTTAFVVVNTDDYPNILFDTGKEYTAKQKIGTIGK